MEEKFIKENSSIIKVTHKAFYNPAQEINRDISVMAINAFLDISNFKEDNFCIFECMSATGLRGIRYAKEITEKCAIFMNDIDSDAVREIKENLKINEIRYDMLDDYRNKSVIEKLNEVINKYTSNCTQAKETNTNGVILLNSDCNSVMASNCLFFHVIDVDPFGHFTKNLPFVFKSIKNHGLVCLTATDTAVLCTNRNKCIRKYDVLIRKVPYYGEMALRAALSTTARIAGMYDCGITPLLSLSVDFYVRLFVRVERRTSSVKASLNECAYYFICGCGYTIEHGSKNTEISLFCPVCHNKLLLCGPLWKGKLNDSVFLSKLDNRTESKRVSEILRLIKQENTCFGFYHVPTVCSLLKTECIPIVKLVSELLNRGKKVSFTHCRANSIKTDCQYKEITEIIRSYFKNKDSIADNELAIEICSKKYNRDVIHDNMGPLSKPSK
ncbi:tRNA methyltransferase [Trachipleistophora hominis]|uniref:tRNA (guanine(26)-N(2))-dimethyltransferase n=1 Tax=Trachipleistophora hominis TaxID=72359 RepID=L7JTS9_TRAHO|nr:tRNA methyltransferase [Trachipleistophora hominis]